MLTNKIYKRLFAFRNPKTGLFWDGRVRFPQIPSTQSYISKNYVKYDDFWSNDWSPKWIKTPYVFRDSDVIDETVARYFIDLKYFPIDAKNKPIPTELELIEYTGKFDIKTRLLDLASAVQVKIEPATYDQDEFEALEIRLFLGQSIYNAYARLQSRGNNMSEYKYAIRVKSFKEFREDGLPFEHLFQSSILFVKDEVSLTIARMALGSSYSNYHKLFDFGVKT